MLIQVELYGVFIGILTLSLWIDTGYNRGHDIFK
jgi:hypothetical protein